MRVQRCPHCGAENSLKRTTCYHCQKDLASQVVARNTAVQRPAANSRWAAIEPVPPPPAAPPLSQAMSSPVAGPAAASPAPRPRPRIGVAPRNSIRHVRQMAAFYRELHSLLRAGINVAAACHELEHRGSFRFRPLARDMAAAAEAGRPVSSVFANYRHLIYPWHLGVVRAAESAGSLPEAVDQIAAAYELEWQTRAEIALRSFIYLYVGIPALLLVIPVILMLNQPFPKEGWDLPYTLQLLRRFLLTVTLPIGAGLLGFLLIWKILSGTAWFQAIQHRAVLLLPVIGAVSRAGAVGRYLSTLSMLLKAGVPVSESADEAAMAAGNAALTPRLLTIAPKVQSGVPLAQAMQETRVFDGDTLRLAGTGEMTGSLPEMLGRAAQYCLEKHESRRRILMKLVGVAFTLAFGAIVCIIVVWGARSYFDAMFRGLEWMEQG